MTMSEQQQLTNKEELLAILQESIKYVQNISDEEILKKKTTLNTDKGMGYLLSNEQFHIWVVKKEKKF